MRNGNRNSCSEDLGLIFYMKIHQDREKGRKEHGGGSPKLSPKAQNIAFPSLV